MNKYTSAHVANYFLSSACDENISMTPLKLMKLVYFSYAWYLYLTNNDLFNEEIQAWKHGPVIPSIFHEFKQYGLYGDIRGQYATYIDLSNEDAPIPQKPIVNINELETNDALNSAICGVWFFYKKRSGDELEEISHSQTSAWSKYYEVGKNIVLNRESDKIEKIKARAKEGYDLAVKSL